MRFSPYLALFLVSVLVGCNSRALPDSAGSAGGDSAAQLSNRIYAVSYPLQFLTQQISGQEIEVLLPFAQSDDPRKSRPTREVIAAMQDSDLVIANGVGARYAKWLALVSLPDSKIVSTASRGLALKDYIQVKGESIVHSHGPEGEHSHPVMAARTWLDPSLAKKQAKYIATQLKKNYPDRADLFDQNLAALQARLDELVEAMDLIAKRGQAESPMVWTAGSEFEFFTRAAGLTAEPLKGFSQNSKLQNSDLSNEKLLVAVKEQLQAKPELASQANKNSSAGSLEGKKPKLVLIAERLSLSEELSALFLSLGIQPVRIDPLDHPLASSDYISTMKLNIKRVETALDDSVAEAD